MAIAACKALAGIDDLVIGDCKGGACPDEAGTSSGDDPGTHPDATALPAVDSGVPCVGRDPPGVRVGSAGNTFCIDSTEVTFGDYDLFLQAAIDPATQPPICAWNESFHPAIDIPDGGSPPPPDHPVAAVDWCDALAYCTWAGKYLCGTVENGKKTGPVTVEGASNHQSHQWLLACTGEGRSRYPYGGVFDPSKCNVGDLDAGGTMAVGSNAGCVGAYAGVHDLIGNVWEWYDGTCQAVTLPDGGDGGPGTDICGIRGASFNERGAGNDCEIDGRVPRNGTFPNVGFRCCSD
jgi:formylglycine-generating enzyme required for sulfatase activity